MKKIIISLAAGLVIGYGVSTVMENSEIVKLEAENGESKQQVAKLSEQLLIAQKRAKQEVRIVPSTKSKALTGSSLNKPAQNKEQMLAQRKQAAEEMRIQQKQRSQQSAKELEKEQIKTTENGIVL